MKSDKVNQFIIKLIKLTKGNELEWDPVIPFERELLNGSVILDKIYKTELGGKNFNLYKYKYKYYKEEFDYEWFERIQLDMVDEKGYTDFEFTFTNSMKDLYDIVREKCSNVGIIIDELLGLRLELMEAFYGSPNKTIEVTKQLEEKIIDNKLNFIVSNEIAGDPDPGIVKKLRIIWQYSGEVLEKEFDEGQIVNLP